MRDRLIAEIIQGQNPLTLPPDATLAAACEAMYRRRVGAVMVVRDADLLLGIFTGRDAVRCLAEGRKPTAKLADVMTRQPETVTPEQHASDALRLLNDGGFRHLPVCEDGRVRGILSRYDFRAAEHAQQDTENGFFENLR
ncbi:cyclic nucleotide-binding/CBS domain-containing protein [Falsiroseomonas sp.]|uniref:CBS domain-containing protein n=1 Tax=Falsiroseomonas sp. TaxID=2870721 RepID=UPI0027251025|nr:CBS domain-containing protein [Falsiroseomonas sp.]MDO9502916.1 CBS domain-containing protein [Falsiroseomonas sp.]MDP3418396.1 CBS domain-containing protein [Falsiroseomonas sp.]